MHSCAGSAATTGKKSRLASASLLENGRSAITGGPLWSQCLWGNFGCGKILMDTATVLGNPFRKLHPGEQDRIIAEEPDLLNRGRTSHRVSKPAKTTSQKTTHQETHSRRLGVGPYLREPIALRTQGR